MIFENRFINLTRKYETFYLIIITIHLSFDEYIQKFHTNSSFKWILSTGR